MLYDQVYIASTKSIYYDLKIHQYGYISLDNLFEEFIKKLPNVYQFYPSVDDILSYTLKKHPNSVEAAHAFLIQKTMKLLQEDRIELIIDDEDLSNILNIKHYSDLKHIHIIKEPEKLKLSDIRQFYHNFFKIKYPYETVNMLAIMGVKS